MTERELAGSQNFEIFRYIHSFLIEKDLFIIYAVDTVRGCKHPIVANLQDFDSFQKDISEIY